MIFTCLRYAYIDTFMHVNITTCTYMYRYQCTCMYMYMNVKHKNMYKNVHALILQ